MKKYKLLILTAVVVVVFIFSFSALAETSSDVVVSLQIDNPIMQINGVPTEIDVGRGTAPIVTQGRSLVPVRYIIEAFGGTVNWDESSQSVWLYLDDEVIRLIIDSNTAYLNDEPYTLDVAPTVINDRTMLPIRFVAEGFNLGVAWNEKTQTVSIIRNLFDESEYRYLMSILPDYSGEPYVKLNNNVPFFKDYEIIDGSFEYYSTLDELGRCDVCMASISTDIMPTEKRESISSVIPTGWINAEYDIVDGRYLYNRCHLIGYQLTGENSNERNLITGTRYLNIEGMLPFENMVDDYVEQTHNHVVYRSTPVFSNDNLVADGVLIEAYSAEDNGAGISFCVYCYNVQPDITIDYQTGKSSRVGQNDILPQNIYKENNDKTEQSSSRVYRTPTGKKYHFDAECGGKNSYEITLEEALNSNLTPCSKCAE